MQHTKTIKSKFHTVEIQVTLTVDKVVKWEVKLFLIPQGKPKKQFTKEQLDIVTDFEIHEAKLELWELIKPKN